MSRIVTATTSIITITITIMIMMIVTVTATLGSLALATIKANSRNLNQTHKAYGLFITKHPVSGLMIRRTAIMTSILTVAVALAAASPNIAYAEIGVPEKLEFGAALEETLGHFRALEQNLDAGNTELAMTHATHPVAELYDSMKPTLAAADPALDRKFGTILGELRDKASTEMSRSAAQSAIDDAKGTVEEARMAVIGAELSSYYGFKLMLMTTLLETSIAEYGEAVSDGSITEMAEFQDGSAFVWRSQQILQTMESELDSETYGYLKLSYGSLWDAYDARLDPSEVSGLTDAVLRQVEVAVDEQLAERLEFGAALEETLGHFRALEQNLDAGNTELAMTHATHPVAELYDSMKPTLAAADPALDRKFGTILGELRDKASTEMSRSAAQSAIDDAKGTVEEARMAVIGAELSSYYGFKLMLMTTLLETSIAEYGEAVSDGSITEMAEFQDGSAFVWRAEQILRTAEDDLSGDDYEELVEVLGEINEAYDDRLDPSEIDERTSYLLAEINGILGVTGGEEDTLLTYVNNINVLLEEARKEYNAGNSDLALSHVTKAYLNNYEFLEAPLIEAGERELMERVEVMMREELRNMIKQGAPASEVSDQIDAILIEMEAVAVVVPEFGVMASVVFAAAVALVMVFSISRRFASISILPTRTV